MRLNTDPINYIVKDGERLDLIIGRHYDLSTAELPSILEYVYNQNPNLAAVKQPYETGLTIYLPRLPELEKGQKVNLWG